MTELIIWKNREINKLRRDIERTFRRCCTELSVPFSPSIAVETYAMDLSETDDTLMLTARLPGIRQEDVNISLTDDALTIEAKRTDQRIEDGGDYHRIEEHTGSFSRTIRLPQKVNVDDSEATFKDDVLKIVMPKRKLTEIQGTHIQIR